MKEGQKFARVCSITKEGMNEGFCINDGEMYIKNESDLIKWLRSRNVDENNELSDDYIMQEAYDCGEYYYTEWDDVFDAEYIVKDGKLIELED
jgi:hypothetical protein